MRLAGAQAAHDAGYQRVAGDALLGGVDGHECLQEAAFHFCVGKAQVVVAHVEAVAHEGVEIGAVHLDQLAVVGLVDVYLEDINKASSHEHRRQAHHDIGRRNQQEVQYRHPARGNIIVYKNGQDEHYLELERERNAEENERRDMLPLHLGIHRKQDEGDVHTVALSPERRIEYHRYRAEHQAVSQNGLEAEDRLFDRLADNEHRADREHDIEEDRQQLVCGHRLKRQQRQNIDDYLIRDIVVAHLIGQALYSPLLYPVPPGAEEIPEVVALEIHSLPADEQPEHRDRDQHDQRKVLFHKIKNFSFYLSHYTPQRTKPTFFIALPRVRLLIFSAISSAAR